jgi:MFS family permease
MLPERPGECPAIPRNENIASQGFRVYGEAIRDPGTAKELFMGSLPHELTASGAATAGLPPRNRGLGPVLAAANLTWLLPVTASGTLLLALFGEWDDATKISRYSTLSVISAVAAMVANLVFGILSDRTRSGLGRRAPWILGGSVGAAVCGSAMSYLDSFPLMVVVWIGFQVSLNAVVAPLGAVVADRVPAAGLGKASSWIGVGTLLGRGAGGVLAGMLVAAPILGLRWVFWLIPLGALLLVFLAPDRSSRDLPRGPFVLREFARSLLPPRDADLLWAIACRLLALLGIDLVLVYQLYVMTDYLGLATKQAGSTIAAASLITVFVAGLATAVAGPMSDRVGQRKPFIIVSATVGAAAMVPLLISSSLWAYFTFVVVGALGFGGFLAVDQAVMAEVLPQAEAHARDLAFLNVANTVPSLLAPVIAASVVTSLGYHVLFALGIAIAVAGGLCILPIRRVA